MRNMGYHGKRGADEPPRGICRCGHGPNAYRCCCHTRSGPRQGLSEVSSEYLQNLKADLEKELRMVEEKLAEMNRRGGLVNISNSGGDSDKGGAESGGISGSSS